MIFQKALSIVKAARGYRLADAARVDVCETLARADQGSSLEACGVYIYIITTFYIIMCVPACAYLFCSRWTFYRKDSNERQIPSGLHGSSEAGAREGVPFQQIHHD